MDTAGRICYHQEKTWAERREKNHMNPLIFQSDFGRADGAVSAMYGVAYSVCSDLKISDLTHEIPQYDIWEASYRLIQTVSYWPEGGQYVVTPDNGTLTHIKKLCGITEARVIDETVNRLPGSGESYTFHGRDIYAYTGARLASGIIDFEGVGPEVPVDSVVEIPFEPARLQENEVSGTIDVLDVRFGSLWTNIPRKLFLQMGVAHGDRIEVIIEKRGHTVYRTSLIYAHSFADAFIGEALVYVNSLDFMAVAINQGNFARAYNVGTGLSWRITMRKSTLNR